MLKVLLRRVRDIPKGKVATYGEVARAAGYPGAARQVAWALHGSGGGLPWHRVVGAGGRILLGGDAGMEQRLRLRHEGVAFRDGRIDMRAHEHRFPGGTR
jgi:methylated-DNA-protein-cysteine methyltransferase related protein